MEHYNVETSRNTQKSKPHEIWQIVEKDDRTKLKEACCFSFCCFN